jgi:hypothetical protein
MPFHIHCPCRLPKHNAAVHAARLLLLILHLRRWSQPPSLPVSRETVLQEQKSPQSVRSGSLQSPWYCATIHSQRKLPFAVNDRINK